MSTTIWDDPSLAGAQDGKTQEGEDDQQAADANRPNKSARGEKRSKKKRSKLYGSFMRLTRRVHLYCGLFMLPFVLMYGISAAYFNHPTWISSSTTREFDASALAGANLQSAPQPELLAKEILAAINAQELDEQTVPRAELELAADPNPRYSGSISYTYRHDDEQFTISIDPASQAGRIRRSEIRTANSELKQPHAFAQLPARADLAKLGEQTRTAAVAVLKKAGVETGSLEPSLLTPGRRSGARFLFDAQSAGESYRVSYDLTTGRGTAMPLGEAPEFEPERFLMRLHVSHGYPDEINIRWWWAFIVDAMFINMVMWGLSGVLMWWQLKKTRKLGMLFLIASAIVTCWLFIGMHNEFVASARARSAPQPQVTRSAPSTSEKGSPGSPSAGSYQGGRAGRGQRSGGQSGQAAKEDAQPKSNLE